MRNTHVKTRAHTHTQMRLSVGLGYSERQETSLFFSVWNCHGARKSRALFSLSLSLWEPWTVFMIYDNRAKRGESVPVKQQQKPHRQHTYTAQKQHLEKNPPPLNRMWEFLKYSSAGNSPFSGVFETAPLECGYSNPISLMVFLRPPRVHVLTSAARLYLTETWLRHLYFCKRWIPKGREEKNGLRKTTDGRKPVFKHAGTRKRIWKWDVRHQKAPQLQYSDVIRIILLESITYIVADITAV